MGFSISQSYSGNYLKAQDLPQPRCLTIQGVTQQELDGQKKLVVVFAGESQQFVLNKTNATTLASIYGDNTDNWKGQQVELYAATVFFQGRQVPCIRVRQPTVAQQMPWDGPAAPQQQVPPSVPQAPPAPQQAPVQQPPMQAPDYPADA